jgi:hypothetical protein
MHFEVKFMKKRYRILSMTLALVALPVHFARASQIYSFSGKVTAITDDTVTLLKNGESREFLLGQMDHPGGMNGVKVGDDITAWYTYSLKHVQMNQRTKSGKAGEQPGQRGEEPQVPKQNPIPGQVPGVKDDRGFYSA